MKKFFSEFKAFAARGNVIDLAVGVVIGGAFGAITSSLVNDLVMPLVGLFIGGVDLTSWVINIPNFIYGGDPIALNIGLFISAIVDFLIIAFVLFCVIKAINSSKKKKEEAPAAPPAPSAEEKLLTEIRDILKEKK
ncbi:MAG: large-conductance mechanosensitive channel protein MscL [Ruminococcaceae bacterium]|nr:large-conductance mechanosensitive channel protein MscL [Oscillospiraceae bacterium]